jgi:hypothetical protein
MGASVSLRPRAGSRIHRLRRTTDHGALWNRETTQRSPGGSGPGLEDPTQEASADRLSTHDKGLAFQRGGVVG